MKNSTWADMHDEAAIWAPAFFRAAWTFFTAALLVVATYTIFFRSFHPEFTPFLDREVKKLVVPGKDLIPASVGKVSKVGSAVVIEDFNGDEAVLVMKRRFLAEDFPFIKVNLSGFTRFSKFKIIWRRTDKIEQSHALEFNRSGDKATQIAMVNGAENYRGEIADIALLFYDGPARAINNNNDTNIVISSIELLPFSFSNVTQQILTDWFNGPLLTHYSNNVVRGIPRFQSLLSPGIFFNSLFLLWASLLVLANFIWRNKLGRGQFELNAKNLGCLLIISWLLLDGIRWSWRLEQVKDTAIRFHQQEEQNRNLRSALACGRIPDTCSLYEF